MKLKPLLLMLPLLAAAIPYLSVNLAGLMSAPPMAIPAPMVATGNDFSNRPHYPAPWRLGANGLIDAEQKRVLAAGVNGVGYTNLPLSVKEADSRATTLDKLGVRVFRPHHMDLPLRDNPRSHGERFQRWLDALKRKKIPVIMETASSQFSKEKLALGEPTETARWKAYVDQLFKLDLSNVVAICPVNEPAPTSEKVFRAQYDYIRSKGFKGLIFASNAMIARGPQGDVADIHLYCGLHGQPHDQFLEIEFKDEPWNHPKPQRLPIIATEIGHFWPASTRYQSEWQIIESLLKVDAQVIIMYALINHDDEWKVGSKVPLSQDSFANDPERMETLARLVNRMAGVDYFPKTYTPGLKRKHIEGGKWKIGTATSASD